LYYLRPSLNGQDYTPAARDATTRTGGPVPQNR
jgi:hypothetical protein